MINDKLLAKYSVLTVEQRNEAFPEFTNNEECMYKEFLSATDHIPVKIFESFIENMASASVLEMPNVIINFFKDIKVTYNEVLVSRKIAREEINKLNN